MKLGQITQKLKNSLGKHYVRKKDFEALSDEVNRLAKKLAKLEKSSVSAVKDETAPTENTKSKTKEKKAKTEQVEATEVSTENPTQDKLTLIKGIGPVLEKKLHNLEIYRFYQIAGWSEADIEKISEQLDFKGRIQREDWVKQAKDLA